MSLDHEAVKDVIDSARYRDEGVLLEPEGLALLKAAGIPVPRYREVAGAEAVAEIELPPFRGRRSSSR
jgi:hypothetical protein